MKAPIGSLRERLAALPVRGLGAANEAAVKVARNPHPVPELVAALGDERGIVQARASNALKKVQRHEPRSLDAFAVKILGRARSCTVAEARWNLTIVIGGLHLEAGVRSLAVELMFDALASPSAFLRTFALSGLADLSEADETLTPRVRGLLEHALEDPSAAVRARARKLLNVQT